MRISTVPAGNRRRIVICGSMTFIDEMETLAAELESLGFQATTPVREEAAFIWGELSETEAASAKRVLIDGHFEAIRMCDVVLIANYDKHGVSGYVGANTLMEAACGHALAKPVVFLNPLGPQSCKLELAAISSGVLDGQPGRLQPALDDQSDSLSKSHDCP